MLFLCPGAWPHYKLEAGKPWPENGSLRFTTIRQLELFCKREEKWGEIPYVGAFMLLCQNKAVQMKCEITQQTGKQVSRVSGE